MVLPYTIARMIFPCLKLFKWKLCFSQNKFQTSCFDLQGPLYSAHIYFSRLTPHHSLPCTLSRQPVLIFQFFNQALLHHFQVLSLPLLHLFFFFKLKIHFISLTPDNFSSLSLDIASSGETSLDPQVLIRHLSSLLPLHLVCHLS